MLDGKRRLFGVSGLLFRSDVLLFERETQSLFSQLLMRGVTGPLDQEPLEPVPFEVTSWKSWKKSHPETQAISVSTGHARDYGTDPYAGYHKRRSTMFPVQFDDAGRGGKDWSFLVGAPRDPLVVPEEVALSWKDGKKLLPDGTTLTYHREGRRLSAANAQGKELTVVPGYWFAHRAFYPDAPIIE